MSSGGAERAVAAIGPKPYYEHAGVTIYHGDCRDILPHISADAVVTDPVWPNCPDGLLVGADRPGELLSEALTFLRCGVRGLYLLRFVF